MSRACLVDTFALLAMLNPSDARHRETMAWLNASRRPPVNSFVVMNDRGLTEALTADHHFEQAGFVALLK